MRTWAWWSASLAPVALVGGFVLAQSRQPDGADALRATLSSLAAHGAVDPWIMTTGFAVLGCCHVVTAAGLRAAGRPARAAFAVGGLAVLAVAASPQPAALHVPAAGVSFAALAVWPALVPGRLRRVGPALAAANALALVWFVVELRVGPYVGLSERVVAVAEAVTPLIVLVAQRRSCRACATARG